MIVGASYENGSVLLTYSDGDQETIPFNPYMLIPHHLAPHLPHHLEIDTAPGGLYVQAPYHTLIRLYQRLTKISSAIIFPPPERQYLLLNNLRPFSEDITPHLSSISEAYFYLLRTPEPRNPALTFLENILFLHGHARPLNRRYHLSTDPHILLPFFHFNIDASTFDPDGDILLPTTLVEVRGYHQIHSILSLPITIGGRGLVTLGDALLHNLPYTVASERRTISTPSFLHREIKGLYTLFLSSLRSIEPVIVPADPTAYNLLLATYSTLRGIPDLLANTDVLTPRGRTTLLAAYNLLRRDPNIYNHLSREDDTCCPGLRELVSYLPVLSSLLTEHPH